MAGPSIDDVLAGGRRREVVALNLTGTGAVEFTFEALPARGPGSWDELKAKHPATRKGSELAVDIPTFLPAALAACCVAPKMTVAKAQQLIDGVLNAIELDLVWNACLAANIGVNRPESSAASARTPRTRPRSTPRSGSGGRAASS